MNAIPKASAADGANIDKRFEHQPALSSASKGQSSTSGPVGSNEDNGSTLVSRSEFGVIKPRLRDLSELVAQMEQMKRLITEEQPATPETKPTMPNQSTRAQPPLQRMKDATELSPGEQLPTKTCPLSSVHGSLNSNQPASSDAKALTVPKPRVEVAETTASTTMTTKTTPTAKKRHSPSLSSATGSSSSEPPDASVQKAIDSIRRSLGELLSLGNTEASVEEVALYAEYHVATKTFQAALKHMIGDGLIVRKSGFVRLTTYGIDNIPHAPPPETNEEMQRRLLAKLLKKRDGLPPAEKISIIFWMLCDGEMHDKMALATAADYTSLSTKSLPALFKRMTALRLLNSCKGKIQLQDIAFPLGRPNNSRKRKAITGTQSPSPKRSKSAPSSPTNKSESPPPLATTSTPSSPSTQSASSSPAPAATNSCPDGQSPNNSDTTTSVREDKAPWESLYEILVNLHNDGILDPDIEMVAVFSNSKNVKSPVFLKAVEDLVQRGLIIRSGDSLILTQHRTVEV